MIKRSLLSLSIASAMLLTTACGGGNDVGPVEGEVFISPAQGVTPVFKLLTERALPLTTDLLFAGTQDGTAGFSSPSNPVEVGINRLDGFSVSSAIDTAFTGALDPASINNNSVFLLELQNSDSVDALDLGAILAEFQNPVVGKVSTATPQYLLLDGVPTIRLTLSAPLKPKTKYVVVMTEDVQGYFDDDNNPATAAQLKPIEQTEDMRFFTEKSAVGPNNALRAWQDIAQGYLAAIAPVGTEASKAVVSYAFTTGGTTDVLTAMAGPELALIGQGTPPATAVGLVAQAKAGGIINSPKALPFTLIRNPADNTQPFALTPGDIVPGGSTTVRYVQGMLPLPVGFEAPTATNLTVLAGGNPAAIGAEISANLAADDFWLGNTVLAATAGLTVPTDTDGTTNVTYRFPFASLDQTENAPVLVTVPAAPCVAPYPVAIFAHGITADRTSSVVLAAQLANACIATVAIDHPLHGVAPATSSGVNPSLAFNAEQASTAFGMAANAAPATQDITERHHNIGGGTGAAAAARVPMNFNSGSEAGTSGAHFINLGNFARSRDNARQAIVDLLNLNASLAGMDVTGDGTPDFDTDKVYFIGHSLGAILGASFVAVNNFVVAAEGANGLSSVLNPIQAAVLGNPGTQLTKLLENSPAFAPTIVGGLAASGITQGSASFESFMQVLQAMIDSADPVAFSGQMGQTPVLLLNMVGGGAIGSDTPAIPAGILAATGGVNYPADHVVPNYSYFGTDANPYRALAPLLTPALPEVLCSTKSLLAGTNPMVELYGLTKVNQTGAATTLNGSKFSVEFATGSHGTLAAADSPATFGAIVGQIISFFNPAGVAGQSLNTTDDDVLAIASTPDLTCTP